MSQKKADYELNKEKELHEKLKKRSESILKDAGKRLGELNTKLSKGMGEKELEQEVSKEKEKKQKAIEYIKTIEELSGEEISKFIKMLENGEEVNIVFDAIEDVMQEKIDHGFEELGITLDEDDPEYKAMYKKAMNEMEAAEKDFVKEMQEIESEADQLEIDTRKDLDELKNKN
ncbi:MAG: hypothetical protein JXI43_05410 [Tissierellales bacterium]|nr:hypothetical protein [Tissierellales bacterium]